MTRRAVIAALSVVIVVSTRAGAQVAPAGLPLALARPEQPAGQPVTMTLAEALERAKKHDVAFLASATDAQAAREDRLQARAALLPNLSHTTQGLFTQPGELPGGRFVSNDGAQLYRSWAVLRQEISPNLLMGTPLRKAKAAEAEAAARADVAARGLAVTVTRNYYGLVAAEHRFDAAKQAADAARHFLDMVQRQQRLGQVAHADEVKAELQSLLQQQAWQDAQVALDNARLSLAVLLFPDFETNFSVVDDLASAPTLPPFPELKARAAGGNADLRAAMAGLEVARQDVQLSRNAFLPSVSIDADYGIEANAFALHSVAAAAPELGVLPNLGYFVTANLTVPVWDWGGLRSKLRQSQARAKLAEATVSQAQRQALANLYTFYNEATAAQASLATSRRIADLAAESLRLVTLRYEAGEATALEVVDAQNTLVQARTGADDAAVRYRVSLANLQTLSGTF